LLGERHSRQTDPVQNRLVDSEVLLFRLRFGLELVEIVSGEELMNDLVVVARPFGAGRTFDDGLRSSNIKKC
jgi:hypothetical protein